MKTTLKIHKILRLALIPILLLGCDKDCEDDSDAPAEILPGAGWNSNENYAQTIPVAINYGNYQSGGSLPASVDLTSKFPPVGNQGMLGTCVAWATAYANKTYLDGVARNLSPAALQSSVNQYSPTDLFFSINPSLRNCDSGTNFDDAFNVLISRGVNTMYSVPYDEYCRATSPGSAATAASNKIKTYRRIQGSVTEIKEYLAQGLPVVIGAMVNRQFKEFYGSSVLQGLNYNITPVGGHAMVIAGYDDSRNAFRIVNSWGTNWGDQGYIWVDYNFLVNQFCVQGGQKSLFVAFNENTTVVNPPAAAGGPDLTALVTSDFSAYQTSSFYINARRAYFDVKNIGNQTISASTNWNIYYLWVNAFNANNYGIIFRGELTTSIPVNTYQNINSNYALINCNLAPGATLGQTLAGLPYVNWDYLMPQITGSYYLIMYIDKGSSSETNQTNNVFYVTQSPKYFNNGYSPRTKGADQAAKKHHFESLLTFRHQLSPAQLNDEDQLLQYRSPSKKEFANAYTAEEIRGFIEYKLKHGGL